MSFDSFWDPNGIGNATRFGGLLKSAGRVRKPEPPPQEEPAPESPVEEKQEEKAKVILRNPKWEIEKVGFNEETDISVEAELPEAEAHKTKVAFELFAKVPGKPERISQAEGQIKDGKAVARVPVYIPQYKDEDGNPLAKVEYTFTAKHSASEPLESPEKLVDEMANLLIDRHILEDATFATGKSQVQPGKASRLKALTNRIAEWKEKHPEGKLAVFGHADAVGKEEPNKALSERRSKCIHAFLMKDAATWDALAKEEKWDRKGIPDFQAFMDENNPHSLAAKDFDAIDGKPYAGCSEFNPIEAMAGAHEPNRRVSVFLLKSTKNFPIQYPCKHGSIAPCKAQVGRKGPRRTAGFGCLFYDKLVTEATALIGDFEVLLQIDTKDPRAKDDELILVDEGGEEVKRLKVGEMQEEGEDQVRLLFEGVDLRKKYSLVRDYGSDEEGGRDALWVDLSPEEIQLLFAEPDEDAEEGA